MAADDSASHFAGNPGGFSLLEVLVAVAIVGVAFVTLFEIFGRGLNLAAKADLHTSAVINARSMMDEMLAQPEPGSRKPDMPSGDGFRYSANAARVDVGEEGGASEVYDVTVAAEWGKGGSLVLVSRKTVGVERESK